MGLYLKLICIAISFLNCGELFTYSYAQSAEFSNSLRLINDKYEKLQSLSYNLVSAHQSLVSDTIDYAYSTMNYRGSCNPGLGIYDFYSTTEKGYPMFGYFNNQLYNFNRDDHLVYAWDAEDVSKLLRRGDFRWATFSPYMYRRHLIDTSYWNYAVSQSISVVDDTLILCMERFYNIEEKFHDDDPDIGSTRITIKVSLLDSLIYYYEEILKVAKRPEITRYYFSNYNQKINLDKLDTLQSKFISVISEREVITRKKNKVPSALKNIKEEFSPNFIMYDMAGDSTRLGEFNEQYIILDFWFSGCPPCIKASAVLNEIWRIDWDADIKIVGINYVDKDVQKILQYTSKIPYDQYFLKDRSEIRFLDYYGAPTIILYDKINMKVYKVFEGYDDAFKSNLINALSLWFTGG